VDLSGLYYKRVRQQLYEPGLNLLARRCLLELGRVAKASHCIDRRTPLACPRQRVELLAEFHPAHDREPEPLERPPALRGHGGEGTSRPARVEHVEATLRVPHHGAHRGLPAREDRRCVLTLEPDELSPPLPERHVLRVCPQRVARRLGEVVCPTTGPKAPPIGLRSRRPTSRLPAAHWSVSSRCDSSFRLVGRGETDWPPREGDGRRCCARTCSRRRVSQVRMGDASGRP